jgi:hypothetical protein
MKSGHRSHGLRNGEWPQISRIFTDECRKEKGYGAWRFPP